MFAAWSRLPIEQRRLWMVAGAIAAGTVVKVSYFTFSRRLLVDDHQRKEKEGLDRLAEAREFAKWSKKDRESRLPPLTEEQKEQMRNYLKIVERHGLSQAFQNPNGIRGNGGTDEDCIGCPIVMSRRRGATPKEQPASV